MALGKEETKCHEQPTPVVRDRRATWTEKALVQPGHCGHSILSFQVFMIYALSMMIVLEDTGKNYDSPRHTDHCSLVLQEVILPNIRVPISEKAIALSISYKVVLHSKEFY